MVGQVILCLERCGDWRAGLHFPHFLPSLSIRAERRRPRRGLDRRTGRTGRHTGEVVCSGEVLLRDEDVLGGGIGADFALAPCRAPFPPPAAASCPPAAAHVLPPDATRVPFRPLPLADVADRVPSPATGRYGRPRPYHTSPRLWPL
jgi:hypothetical protein